MVGFAAERPQKLGDITITSHTPYASIILTALDQKATLATTQSALLTAVAREAGSKPVKVEPVQFDVGIANRAIDQVNVLDQNGVLTQKTVPVNQGTLHINTGRRPDPLLSGSSSNSRRLSITVLASRF